MLRRGTDQRKCFERLEQNRDDTIFAEASLLKPGETGVKQEAEEVTPVGGTSGG